MTKRPTCGECEDFIMANPEGIRGQCYLDPPAHDNSTPDDEGPKFRPGRLACRQFKKRGSK